MSRPTHLDFSESTVPISERHNPHASTDFPWEELFEKCDADLQSAKACVEARDYEALGEAITVLMRAILSARNNAGRGWLEAVGRRAVAVAFVYDPRLFEGKTAAHLAVELQVSKQNCHERINDALAFIHRNSKKRKPDRSAIGDATTSKNENHHTKNLPVAG